jgi:hemerythrin-like metal-binding protein
MGILIDNFEQRYLLGIDKMDETHKAFAVLVNRLGMADKEEFITHFPELVSHTKEHFEQEKQWMEASGFSATHEHLDDHQRILGELDRFAQRVSAGSIAMGRAYVTQQLPQWFDIHAKTMDSALASHLKTCSLEKIENS